MKKASQEGQSSPLKALGTQLPDSWTPDDELCEDLKREFGMSEEDIRSELLAFHAHHASSGTFSANWRASFITWGKRWKDHRDKQAPPRIELQRTPGTAPPFEPTAEDFDKAAAFYARSGTWMRGYGPDPTSPACRCPKITLSKHGIDPESGERRIPPRAVSK